MLELTECDNLHSIEESDSQIDAAAADEPTNILADDLCVTKLMPDTATFTAPVEISSCFQGMKDKDVMSGFDLCNTEGADEVNPPMLMDIVMATPPML